MFLKGDEIVVLSACEREGLYWVRLFLSLLPPFHSSHPFPFPHPGLLRRSLGHLRPPHGLFPTRCLPSNPSPHPPFASQPNPQAAQHTENPPRSQTTPRRIGILLRVRHDLLLILLPFLTLDPSRHARQPSPAPSASDRNHSHLAHSHEFLHRRRQRRRSTALRPKLDSQRTGVRPVPRSRIRSASARERRVGRGKLERKLVEQSREFTR